MSLRAVYFDAGGTLVFPDPSRTLAPFAARGIIVTQEQLYAAERAAKRLLDEGHTRGLRGVDAKYWDFYYASLLTTLGAEDAELQAALVAAARRGSNWRVMRPNTADILARVHAQYRVGLISNSDGTVADLLRELGLGEHFDSFTDSHHCGHEKPDPRIFSAALQSLAVAPEEALYVGDIYSVDYAGAQSCGIQAVLMDPAGAYAGTGYHRISSLENLLPLLS